MQKKQNRILTTMFPLTVSIFIVIIILTLSFVYKLYELPFWIKEGGVIETLSVLGYFLCALLMLFMGKWPYIKQYHYFFILVVLFGMRELDFDKRFTTMGILKSKFYVSDSVPLPEKIIGLMVISVLIYIIVFIIKNHYKILLNIKNLSFIHIGVLLTFSFLVLSKAIDGIGRKLSGFGVYIESKTVINFEVIEEVLELGIPLLIISTLFMYFSTKKQ
ncbi:MAG: hypothetical protein KAH20_10840 [Methylococcales bacterium]|nr:hypothetical protein [Methylococcales bacterium]